MNTIREIQALNKREIENGVSPEASWHADYRDTAYIYIGGLPFELSEGDVIAIFSQFGEPVHVNLLRDKETGKSKGFAFLKYEDQRSTDLAVDNLGGATVMGRTLKVDHTRYKRKDEDELGDNLAGLSQAQDKDDRGQVDVEMNDGSASEGGARPLLKEEEELARLIHEHDDDDPMKEYLIKEKQEEVDQALALQRKERKRRGENESGRRHRHRHRDRSRDGKGREDRHRHRHHRASRPREPSRERRR